MKNEMKLARVSAMIALGLFAGCGDDDVVPGVDAGAVRDAETMHDSGSPRDAGTDAAVAVDGGADAGPPTCPSSRILVTTSDYVTGGLATVDLGLTAAMLSPSAAADQDTVSQRVGCNAVLLEHGLGNVRVQNPASPLTTLRSINVNPMGMTLPYASNPVSVVSITDARAYVVRLSTSSLAIIDLSRDGAAGLLGEIDLTPLAAAGDTDSVDATDAVRVSNRAYVALGRYVFDMMGRISFPDGSVLAVVDTTTDMLVDADTMTMGVQGIALTGDNPRAGVVYDMLGGGRLLVGTTGAYGAMDGGIEGVDLATLRSTGFILTEAELGGDLDFFVVYDMTHAFVVSGGVLRAWNPQAAALGATLVSSDVSGIVLDGSTLYVASRAGPAIGLRSFNATNNMETTPMTGPLVVGTLPIYGMAPVP